jgi:short-subunit dehydrogenase
MNQIKDLKGHRALVTGASSGLGEEYARQLAARGADLVIAARRTDRLQSLAAKLTAEHGVKVEVHSVDLGSPGAALHLHDKATASGAQVTLLINNAGIGPFAPFVTSATKKHLDTVQLNAVALTELCHYFSRHMLAHGRPSFIENVGSIASFQGVPNFAVYSATKAYVRVFSEILRRELQGTNVSVTVLCPGGTYTEFSATNGQVLKETANAVMMTAEEVVRQGLQAMFARRAVVIPGLINKLACFLPRFVPSGLALSLAHVAMSRSASVAELPDQSIK